MKEHTKDVLQTVAATGIGAAAGAGTYGLIGVVEITAGGTSVGITLGPFIAIGASVGFASYGIYWLGKKIFFLSIPKKKAFVGSIVSITPDQLDLKYKEIVYSVRYNEDTVFEKSPGKNSVMSFSRPSCSVMETRILPERTM